MSHRIIGVFVILVHDLAIGETIYQRGGFLGVPAYPYVHATYPLLDIPHEIQEGYLENRAIKHLALSAHTRANN